MGEQGQSPTPHAGRRRVLSGALQLASVLLGAAWLAPTRSARAIGPSDVVDVRRVSSRAGPSDPHPRAAQRLAWEVRKRTSIETQLDPSTTTFDDPSIYRTPLLYWAGDRAFPELSDKELTGLRRFVEYGGMLVIDDASPEVSGFDASVRRALGRAFPGERLTRLSNEHTIFRSFYLLDGPAGRVAAPDYVEGIVLGGRAAVVYSRHDLGGAWSADDGRDTSFVVVPGGSAQREQAVRLGVNLVMYALCLDYKDDQVHAPFLLRRRAGRP